MKVNPLVGKEVVAVFLASDGGAIKFVLIDNTSIIARADGDCCSHTWIENVQLPENMIGTVRAVEDIDMPISMERDGELKFYGCKITTEHGSCVIDYRNESNGYYGGDLCWPDDNFYGGVHEQNVSNEDWKQIAPEVIN